MNSDSKRAARCCQITGTAYLIAFPPRRLRYLKRLHPKRAGGPTRTTRNGHMVLLEASPSSVFRDGRLFSIKTHHPKFKRGAPAWRAPCSAPRLGPSISRRLILRWRRRLLSCAARTAITAESSSPHEL